MVERPILMRWQGDGFLPANHFWAKQADAEFVIGELYPVLVVEDRSAASHRHYFAAVNEAWKNLPERYDGEFPTADALRKYALIKSGYCDRRSIVVGSRAEALRLVPFVKAMDEFSLVVADGATVTVYTAKSQSMRAMGKEAFGASKQAVLEILGEMIGTTPQALQQSRAA